MRSFSSAGGVRFLALTILAAIASGCGPSPGTPIGPPSIYIPPADNRCDVLLAGFQASVDNLARQRDQAAASGDMQRTRALDCQMLSEQINVFASGCVGNAETHLAVLRETYDESCR